MLVAIAIIVTAGVGAVLAGYVLWWAAQRGGLWNLAMGLLLGVAVFILAALIAYAMVASANPF